MSVDIEALFALLETPVQTLFADLVESAHVPLGLTPKVFNAVDMVTTGGDEGLTVIHAPVMELEDVKCIIRGEPVGIHDTLGVNLLADNRHQRLGFGIGNDGGQHFPPPAS